MYESLVYRKLATDWAAVSGLSAAVPGGIQDGQNTGTSNPYARCEISVEQEGYISNQGRFCVYGVLIEIFGDNISAATVLSLEQKMQTLLASSATGTLGGGGGEPTGSVNYAWQKPPPGRSLMNPEEKRAGKTVTLKKLSMSIRAQWT